MKFVLNILFRIGLRNGYVYYLEESHFRYDDDAVTYQIRPLLKPEICDFLKENKILYKLIDSSDEIRGFNIRRIRYKISFSLKKDAALFIIIFGSW